MFSLWVCPDSEWTQDHVPCVRVAVVESRCGEDEYNGFRHWKLCVLGSSDFCSLEPELEVGQRGLRGGCCRVQENQHMIWGPESEVYPVPEWH